MKKFFAILLVICINLMIPTPAYANDAVLGGTGMTACPIYDTDVVMEEEIIDIVVKDGKVYVNCQFFFHNTGEETELLVGFPTHYPGHYESQEEFDSFKDDDFYGELNYSELHRFRTYINSQRVPVKMKKGLLPEGNNTEELYFPQWHTWNMTFDADERIKVTNKYWMELGFGGENSLWFDYILRTGATWRGSVGKVTVRLQFRDFDITDLAFQGMLPTSIENDNTIIWEAENLEPTQDIECHFKDKYRYLGNPFENGTEDHEDYKKMSTRLLRQYNAGHYNATTWWGDQFVKRFGETLTDQFYYCVGVSYYKKGRYEKARNMLENLMDYPSDLYYRALVYDEIGKKDLYRVCLEKLAVYDPYDSSTTFLQLWAKFRLAKLGY